MDVRLIDDYETWNTFVFTNSHETFHQSWEWGDVYDQMSQKAWRIGLYSDNELVGVALVVTIRAKRGTFLLVPHGPIIKNNLVEDLPLLKKIIEALKEQLISYASEEGCSFVRISPIFARESRYEDVFKGLGFRPAPMFTQSDQSLIVDLSLPEGELLKNMRKTTRQILKKPLPDGFSFSSLCSEEGFEDFYNIYKETVSAKGFFGANKQFLQRELSSFLKTSSVLLYFAHYEEKVVGTAFIIVQGGGGFYHYGGHIETPGNIPTGHLLQWHIMKDLKKRGCVRYNLWGVSPIDKPKHPWRGISLFKRGFGGEEREYLHAQDLVLRPTYWFNWVIETARRIKRGY